MAFFFVFFTYLHFCIRAMRQHNYKQYKLKKRKHSDECLRL